jgi:hypothetical protein
MIFIYMQQICKATNAQFVPHSLKDKTKALQAGHTEKVSENLPVSPWKSGCAAVSILAVQPQVLIKTFPAATSWRLIP